jgi:hypothetical protein
MLTRVDPALDRPMILFQDVIGEREIFGGQAAFLICCPSGRKSGYQRRKEFRRHPVAH